MNDYMVVPAATSFTYELNSATSSRATWKHGAVLAVELLD